MSKSESQLTRKQLEIGTSKSPNITRSPQNFKASADSTTKPRTNSSIEMVSSGSHWPSKFAWHLCSRSESGQDMHFQPAHFLFGLQKCVFYRGQFVIWRCVLIIMLYQLNYQANVRLVPFVQLRLSLVYALSTTLSSQCSPCVLRMIKTVSGKCSINWAIKHMSAFSCSFNEDSLINAVSTERLSKCQQCFIFLIRTVTGKCWINHFAS